MAVTNTLAYFNTATSTAIKVEWVFIEMGFHQNGFSSKQVFIETGFHRMAFSLNAQFNLVFKTVSRIFVAPLHY
jgi:hypothetical protein